MLKFKMTLSSVPTLLTLALVPGSVVVVTPTAILTGPCGPVGPVGPTITGVQLHFFPQFNMFLILLSRQLLFIITSFHFIL